MLQAERRLLPHYTTKRERALLGWMGRQGERIWFMDPQQLETYATYIARTWFGMSPLQALHEIKRGRIKGEHVNDFVTLATSYQMVEYKL